jgi:ABC-type sulfate transport system permease component
MTRSKQAASIVVGTCARPLIAQARFGFLRNTSAPNSLLIIKARSAEILPENASTWFIAERVLNNPKIEQTVIMDRRFNFDYAMSMKSH